MPRPHPRWSPRRAALAAFATAVGATPAGAGAQVAVAGVVQGCFNTVAVCTAQNLFASSAAFQVTAGHSSESPGTSIFFTGASFSGTTDSAAGAFAVGRFGAFVLYPAASPGPADAALSTPFSLRFVLSTPMGATVATAEGLIAGAVTSSTVSVAYSGASGVFAYPGGTGSITLDPRTIRPVGPPANDLSGRVAVSGAPLGTTAPEPATAALAAAGLAGIAAARAAGRRRRPA